MNTDTITAVPSTLPVSASEAAPLTGSSTAAPTPSENWIRAVSDFLDTDPSDLLTELGYYKRGNTGTAEAASLSGGGAASG
jgi:hypothetical protein